MRSDADRARGDRRRPAVRRLQIRLTVIYTSSLVLTVAVLGGGLYTLAVRQSLHRVDAELRERAAMGLDAVARHRPIVGVDDDDPKASRTYVVAVGADGKPVRRANLPSWLPVEGSLAAALRSGDDDVRTETVRGIPVRVLTEPVAMGSGRGAVQAAAIVSDQVQSDKRLAELLLIGGSIGAVLAAAAGWLLAGYAARPVAAALTAQRRFVADASHELRTPLAVLRAGLEVGMREGFDDELVQGALRDVDHLTMLVQDLSTLARHDEPAWQVPLQDVDVRAVLDDVASALTIHGAEVHVECGDSLIARADPKRLRQVLLALGDNSVRHGGSDVELRAYEGSGNVTVEVADNGPGMAPDELELATERFWRSDRARAASEGSGLGLAIAKDLAEAQGGALTLLSTPGHGTTAVLQLAASEESGTDPKDLTGL